jgi:hypothetical protein
VCEVNEHAAKALNALEQAKHSPEFGEHRHVRIAAAALRAARAVCVASHP